MELPRFLLVGCGPFALFLAKELLRQSYHVDLLLTAPQFAEHEAQKAAQEVPQARLFHCARTAAAAEPDVVLLCTSIAATEAVLRSFASDGTLQTLVANRLVADVLSVKELPRHLLDQLLPVEWNCEIVCTHPMFGRISAQRDDGSKGWTCGLPLMYEIVRQRIAPPESLPSGTASVVHAFLAFWQAAGCELICMSAEQHDREAAETQFITHVVGRTLALGLDLPASRIATSSYVSLRELVRLHFVNTNADSDALFTGLYRYNRFAAAQLARLHKSFEATSIMLEGHAKILCGSVSLSLGNKCTRVLLTGMAIGAAITITFLFARARRK